MYKLIKQILNELGLDYYYDLIKSKAMNTKMFLNSSKETLKDALKELDEEHISMLYLKAQEHQNRKKFFYDIRDRAIVVEHAAREVAH